MAKIITPLSDTQVKQAKSKEKEYTLADGNGLQLRVRPNGSKLWILKYSQPYTKKRTNLGFGKYPDVSLSKARKQRDEARRLLADNIDPKDHRIEQAQQKKEAIENTFGVVAQKWLDLKRSQVKEETANHAWRGLQRHVLPTLASVPLDNIKPKAIIALLTPIANKGSLETVKRLCRNINEIMRLGVAQGIIEINYLADITKLFAAPKKTNMATIKPERLPELMTALRDANLLRTTRCLLQWQLHTMTRPIEAATARWEDIDLENRVWIIPADRMKMKKPHTIPLTEQTLALLDTIRSMSDGKKYLFTNHRDPTKHANSQSVNMALKRMGFAGELVSHGLRALASTTLNEQGFEPDVIEAALAHIDKNEVRRAYNRAEYLERRRKLMYWWSEHIEQAQLGKFNKSKIVKVVGIHE
ncbi:tyrosine-type recombinase/integrase [Colwellia sp. MB3u-70]|uniref:integrase domain-containing protein n=1 Tax=unclassified Colwellia TaxID=196834 RepID=UPI0015F62868|nr:MULTISPECIES: integrase domain-containing protein [unclassified Colwellia]MBA6291864.1 tyrosine-type recombinase/integrase [Colwellia sp. MB3u-8]MBA6308508.1 tyrosine-type recombinase/integrase [Colwellia sp. MB3u-70]